VAHRMRRKRRDGRGLLMQQAGGRGDSFICVTLWSVASKLQRHPHERDRDRKTKGRTVRLNALDAGVDTEAGSAAAADGMICCVTLDYDVRRSDAYVRQRNFIVTADVRIHFYAGMYESMHVCIYNCLYVCMCV